MDLLSYLRKFVPPLTEEQIKEIAREAEAIVKAQEEAKHPKARFKL
jgi:hypothetical protein